MSHRQQEELDKIIYHLKGIFDSDRRILSALYGKTPEYLGMTIDWLVYGRVIFKMYVYFKGILAEALDDFNGEDVILSVNDLF